MDVLFFIFLSFTLFKFGTVLTLALFLFDINLFGLIKSGYRDDYLFPQNVVYRNSVSKMVKSNTNRDYELLVFVSIKYVLYMICVMYSFFYFSF